MSEPVKPDCVNGDKYKCQFMKETYSDMRGERYRCEVCGQTYYLDYEEMQ